MVLTSRLPSRSTTAYTFFARRLLTNTVPLSPSASERASGMPSAQTSTLNPAGTVSLATGNSLAGLPVICGANGCKVELPCSGVRPCRQAGGGAGAAAEGAAGAAAGGAAEGAVGGAAGGVCCAGPTMGAISPTQASADAIRRRIDTGDMEGPPFPGRLCLFVLEARRIQSSWRTGIIATRDPDCNAAP